MTLRVAGLWRYPVKSLAGEPLREAQLTRDGIPGDRIVHVRGPEGCVPPGDSTDCLVSRRRWGRMDSRW
ncbi:MAG: MOSC N-terminal beta barrel domain-containing protein [Gemmatimonadetes bacterium]|nr:MOSC N-terminal beta barrel domain-containing protein [Gemmatimonadota bacterium]